MTRIQHPLELLAPAKNVHFGIEAIKHHASHEQTQDVEVFLQHLALA